MSKSKEELNEIKEEVEVLNNKLQELTDEELAQVTGGCMEGGIRRDSSGSFRGYHADGGTEIGGNYYF